MRWLKFAIFAYFALIMQTTLLPVVFPDSFRPWALIILANAYLLSKPDGSTVLLIWLIGLFGDLTSLSPLGSQALAFGIYGLLITSMRPILFTESPFAHGITAVIGVILVSAIYAVVDFISNKAMPLPYSLTEILGQALATGVAAWFIIKFFGSRKKTAFDRR
jgi:rod shape-determining protein MreD